MNPADNQFNNASVRSLTGDPIIYCKEGQELKCNGDMDYLLHHRIAESDERFVLLWENKKCQLIHYKLFQDDCGYILKRDKKHNRLTLFREGRIFNCVYKEHLFQAWESGPIIKIPDPKKKACSIWVSFPIIATAIKNGETKSYSWCSLGDRIGTVFNQSNDEIKEMSINKDGLLDLLIHRYKEESDSPGTARKYNYEMDYHLLVSLKGKDFIANPIYPSRQESDNNIKTNSDTDYEYEKPRSLNNILKKLIESAKVYPKPPEDRTTHCYMDITARISFDCDSCGKHVDQTRSVIYRSPKPVIDLYKDIAAEFTKYGCPARLKCYCDECADKQYPTDRVFHNNLVFYLIRGDSRNEIVSFPDDDGLRCFDYFAALEVIKGVNTINGLSSVTCSRYSADRYLDAVRRVLGGVIDPAEVYIPRQETVIEKETHNIEDTIKDTMAKTDEHETLRKTTSVRNETSSRTLPIGIILKKLADSSVNYSPSSDDDVTPTPKKGGQVISYNCDKCGKAEKLIIFIPNKPEKPLFQHYKDLAQEFTESGCPTSIQCLCNNCANKYYPTTYTYRNFLVFTVNREDTKEAIESLPAEKDYDDFDYRVALEVAKGVATIQELSAVTNTHYSAERYLEAVHRVLGNATESIDECLLGQEEMKVDVPTDSRREGKSASETRTAFIADSLTNDKTNEIKTQSEKRQDVRPIAITGNIESFMDYKCASAFIKHYKTMLDIAQKSSIPNDSEFELLPAMFVVSDYAAASAEKDRVAVSNAILKAIKRAFPAFDKAEFDERCSLYGEIIRGKELRCEWYMGDASVFYENAILKCSALLGDILYNPSCADDYDDAPESLYDIVESFEFTENVMDPLIDEFVALFKDIYDA